MARKHSGTVDQTSMRQANLSVVARLIANAQPLSRARISELTGLTKPAVSGLVTELEGLGLVRDIGSAAPVAAGRPANLLEIDGAHHASVAVEVNVGIVAIVVRDLALRVLRRDSRVIDDRMAPDEVLTSVKGWMDEVVDDLLADGRQVIGVVLMLPALVQRTTNTIVQAPALGWVNVSAAGLASPSWGTLRLDNLANLAALAESRLPEHQEHRELVHLEAGSGIGLGIVVDGGLERGSAGFAGAIGHMPLDPDGPVCACGRRGCLEALGAAAGLYARTIPDLLGPVNAPHSLNLRLLREVVARATAGDERALAGIAETGRWIGRGAAVVINTLNPDALTLGGFVRDLGPWILPAILDEIDAMVVAPDRAGCDVTPSRRGVDAIELGAALVVRDGFLSPGELNPRAASA